MEMVRRKKKELLRQELVGLVEVIEPRFGLDEIGGLEPIKDYFAQIVRAIHAGRPQAGAPGHHHDGARRGWARPPWRRPWPGTPASTSSSS